MTRFNINRKKKLKKKIDNLPKEIHLEIYYHLVKIEKIKITDNNNSVFFNLNDLKNETLVKLWDMVLFFEDTDKKLNDPRRCR